MRLIAMSLALVLAGCAGESNPNLARSLGAPTEAFHSEKSAREMAACMTPHHEFDRHGILNWATADGFELVEKSGMANTYAPAVIRVTEDGTGSVTTGYISDRLRWQGRHLKRIVDIIRACA